MLPGFGEAFWLEMKEHYFSSCLQEDISHIYHKRLSIDPWTCSVCEPFSYCIQIPHRDLADPNLRLCKRNFSLWAVGLLCCMNERMGAR